MAGKQILDVRRNADIVIETPEGMIRIRKPIARTHKGKLEIELPGNMKAFVGEDKALDNARFVVRRSDGELVPTYTLLVPVCAANGALQSVRAQTPVRLADRAAPAGPIKVAATG